MSDAIDHGPRGGAILSHALAGTVDKGILLTLVASAANMATAALSGDAPHLAALAAAAVSAAYLSFPKVRALVQGDYGPVCPPAVIDAARRCGVQASLRGDTGIWVVTEGGTGSVSFMTEAEFSTYRATLPPGRDLATVEVTGDEVHVQRFVGGRLQSGDEAAHRVFDLDGGLLRAIDYQEGRYAGEREIASPMTP